VRPWLGLILGFVQDSLNAQIYEIASWDINQTYQSSVYVVNYVPR